MNLRKFFTYCALAGAIPCMAGECYSILDGDTLRMGNDRIERTFLWNNGHLITRSIVDKRSGKVFKSVGNTPDFNINRETPTDGKLNITDVAADGIRTAHKLVTITYKLGNLDVARSYRLYDGIPAIGVDTRLRGTLNKVADKEVGAADRSNIERVEDMKQKPVTTTLDRVSLPGQHWRCKAVEFRDITDWNNNLVDEKEFLSYRKTGHRGNILTITDGERDGGLVFLKEAPCSSVQLNYDGKDFISDFGTFVVTGTGVGDKDISEDNWTDTYGSVLCVFDDGEQSALEAIRSYQKCCRVLDPGRDEMVMMNTWGDRSQDAKVNEKFCLEELEIASRLGITLFQIDDGWQAGKSPNSAVSNGSFKDIYANSGYWTPDPVKYPNGLHPIVKRGKELGIEIGLWFNPSVQNDFADWKRDAETIIGLWKEYGIRMFKIDGLTVNNKTGEENLRKLFDMVLAETGNEVMFNLDATASRRCGYHYFNEYGNIFLENRYTDWGNYYPYWTLRNLWMLSKYVPAEKLQIEFLNKWRNKEKYGEDIFAPSNYDFSYLFAVAMAGQPLAWMEASNLPEEAFEIKPLVEAYKGVSHDFHSGTILPIGDEPSGRSWTGFQSVVSPEEGYLLVFRELNDDVEGSLDTWLPKNSKVELKPVLGSARAHNIKTDKKGRINITIDCPNDFALYKYRVK